VAFDYSTLPTKRVSAAILFNDPSGRVLLVEPTYKPGWEIPGGMVEPNESPRAGAIREIEEELGLHVEPVRLLTVDWIPPYNERTEAVAFIFAGHRLSDAEIAAIRLPEDELRSWAWCTPDEADARLIPTLGRRIRASLQAAEIGSILYLEEGVIT
jgi:8-oxo-dGTP diphosphatase